MTLDLNSSDIELNIDDLLSDITANLVQMRDVHFLSHLFTLKPGEWVPVESLCTDNMKDTLAKLERVKQSIEGVLGVTWLNYPQSVYGEGFCLILFFLEATHWSNIALYNKRGFEETML